MIHTSKQLKDKVRNISKGDNNIAKNLIRNFIMERFLERVSLSAYRDNFILKGGMLVASMVGVNLRATMDIDTTVKALPLNETDAERIISEICAIPVEDGVGFKITSVKSIMTDLEYPEIRMMVEATLDRMKQVFKIDISTDDVITPGAVEYEYKLMFEDRSIQLLSYNTETLLAEKIQTILARGISNTRMRDFYDVYEIMNLCPDKVDTDVLLQAFAATCQKRETVFSMEDISETSEQIRKNEAMEDLWIQFRSKNFFVGDLAWDEVKEYTLEVVWKCVIY